VSSYIGLTMKFLDKKKVRMVISIFIFAVVTGSIVGLDYWENGERAKQMMRDLETEFATIEPLPQATALSYKASYRPRQAWVTSKYVTNLNFPAIRAYYDGELTKRGWSFHNEEQFTDWGRDLGGMEVNYCKGDYTISLHYAGDQSGYKWVYSLDLDWGVYNCK
jgi:hypothetical protein